MPAGSVGTMADLRSTALSLFIIAHAVANLDVAGWSPGSIPDPAPSLLVADVDRPLSLINLFGLLDRAGAVTVMLSRQFHLQAGEPNPIHVVFNMSVLDQHVSLAPLPYRSDILKVLPRQTVDLGPRPVAYTETQIRNLDTDHAPVFVINHLLSFTSVSFDNPFNNVVLRIRQHAIRASLAATVYRVADRIIQRLASPSWTCAILKSDTSLNRALRDGPVYVVSRQAIPGLVRPNVYWHRTLFDQVAENDIPRAVVCRRPRLDISRVPDVRCPTAYCYSDDAPADDALLHRLFLLYREQRQPGVAVACMRSKVAIGADDFAMLADVYQTHGRLEDAELAYQDGLALFPGHYALLVNYGSFLNSVRPSDAGALFERAVAAVPDGPEGLYNLGMYRHGTGDLESSHRLLRRAIQLRAEFPEALEGLAMVERDLNNERAAVQAIESALLQRREPSAASHNLYGVILQHFQHLDQAGAAFQRAVDIDGDFVDAIVNLGYLHLTQYRSSIGHRGLRLPDDRLAVEEAKSMFEHGILASARTGSSPGYAYANLGDLYQDLGSLSDAMAAYEHALQVLPTFDAVFCNLVRARVQACQWDTRQADMERLQNDILPVQVTSRHGHICVHLLHALSYDSIDDELLYGMGKRLADDAEARAPGPPPSSWATFAKGAYRIAMFDSRHVTVSRPTVVFMSSDLRDHPVGRRLQHFFSFIDRRLIRAVAVSTTPDDGSVERQQIMADVEVFLDLSSQSSSSSLVARLRQERASIAIDLNGYTSGARSDVFAAGLAPCQALFLGYAETLGSRSMPYLITDRMASPVEISDPPYIHERLVYHPGVHVFSAYTRESGTGPGMRLPRSDRVHLGLPVDGIVLCSFSQLYKVTPTMFAAWMSILRQTRGTVLWLQEAIVVGAADNIRKEAEAAGMAHRVIITPSQPAETHLAVKSLADLFLDTFPYNSHSTAADALWSGVPIVTLQGPRLVSRVASALLSSLGLDELITYDIDEYVQVVVDICKRPGILDQVRRKLARGVRQASRATFSPSAYMDGFHRVLLAMAEHAAIVTNASTPRQYAAPMHIFIGQQRVYWDDAESLASRQCRRGQVVSAF
ncbi:unnamed protein product (mitochondrion) [Plasmodiophora brassicae]|uniref:protein O-GlcNAc transferase n=1 Tax=Plasmodiophora brassicae TaxID=37360 RepID=A0A3P3Y4G3_PLABS|nr:unnamed protein product [Plasmodiophora brassicae]